jgi:hypothetical protein
MGLAGQWQRNMTSLYRKIQVCGITLLDLEPSVDFSACLEENDEPLT